MIELIGTLGSILLAFCGLPEAILAFKTKRCNIGHGFLGMWLGGEILLLVYNYHTYNDFILYANYTCNIAFILVLYFYKMFPKEEI